MALRFIQFLPIMLTALALVPSEAHLAALPNKIAMAQFGSEFGAHNRAAQAGLIIQLRARLIFDTITPG